ncbi:MAG: SGNH/GDSL hydrolase family protein [Bacteroidota bacterium]
MRYPILFFLFMISLFNCQNKTDETPAPIVPIVKIDTSKQISILALGDSYTKGESVPTYQNYPNQLVDSLRAQQYKVKGIRIIAQTGWRTDQLINAIQNQNYDIADSTFSLVALLIGVNNQYQNDKIEIYQTEFEQLLNIALARAGGRREHVVVISIPDYAYTPFGGGTSAISQGIDAFNLVNQNITNQYGVAYVNVTDISRKGIQQPNLVAADGLHPSAKQYTEWVKRLLPTVKTALK